MSRNCFQLLRANLHISDNENYDKIIRQLSPISDCLVLGELIGIDGTNRVKVP